MHNRVQEQQFTAATGWMTLMDSFRHGIKRKRKRRFFRTFAECFSGNEAIHWLCSYIQCRQQPTAQALDHLQVVRLLEKLVQSGLLVCVWMKKKYKGVEILSNLYRFSVVEDEARLMDNLFRAFVLSSPTL